MKRILLSILFIAAIGLSQSFAQCVPNTSITLPGITPDSATGLSAGVAGSPYNQVMQIKVPVDTQVVLIPGSPAVTVNITSIQLVSFTGLPAGLTYACNPANCTFPGGSNGCVLISGTPTVPGLYPLTAIITTTVTFLGQPISQSDTLSYYSILINSTSTGLIQPADLHFTLSQNIPNPYNDFCSIRYSVPEKTDVEFRMFNVIGKEVYRKQLDADAGVNTLRFDGRDFSPGIYMFSLTFGNETLTRRMVISRK